MADGKKTSKYIGLGIMGVAGAGLLIGGLVARAKYEKGPVPPGGPGQTPPTVPLVPIASMGATEVQAEIARLTVAMGEIARLTIQYGSGSLAYVSAGTQQVLREFPHDWDGEQYFSYPLLNRVAELKKRLYELQGLTPNPKWMPPKSSDYPNAVTVDGVRYPVVLGFTPAGVLTYARVYIGQKIFNLSQYSNGWWYIFDEEGNGSQRVYPA